MSLVSLPTIAETQFAAYLTANLSGTYQKLTADGTTVTGQYSVAPGFTVEPYLLPLIVVKAGKFKEIEPWSHVYEGNLSVTIITQVDDTVSDPVPVHDAAVAEVYALMSNQSGVNASVNSANFHLWGYFNTAYDQEVTQGENKRALVSSIDYQISCQTLPVS